MLTLYGKSNGDLQWKLSEFSDGSGVKKDVIPCISYDMARAEAQKIINQHINSVKEGKSGISSFVIKSAKDNDLILPKWYYDDYKDIQLGEITRRIEDRKNQLNELIEQSKKIVSEGQNDQQKDD